MSLVRRGVAGRDGQGAARSGRAGSTPSHLGRGCRRAGDAPRLSRGRGPVEARSRRRRSSAPPTAGLEVAAWTVTRPPTRRAAGRARGDRRAASKGPRSMASGSVGSRDAAGLVLEAGDVRATLLPEDGGRVGSLVIGGHEVILGGDPDRMRWGSYPMAPFAGRIRARPVLVPGPGPPAAAGHAAARHPRRGVGPAVAGRRRDDALDRPRRPLAVPGPGRPAVRARREAR